ncbi:MAG: hypothetical protein QOH73_2042 [Gaiellaceae bacterium]|nr:hypothetical protein [Gaiellaceae bacterium]
MKTAGQLVLRLVAGELLVEDVVNEQGSVLEHLFRLEPEAAEGVRIEAFLWTRTEGGVLAVAVQNTGEGRIDVRLRLGHSNLRRRVRLEEGERRAQVVLVSILSWFKHLTVSIERGDEEVRIRVPFPSAALRQLPPPKRSQRLLVRLRYVAVVIATVGPLVALSAHRLDLAAVILIAAIGFAEFPRLRVLLARLSRTAPS